MSLSSTSFVEGVLRFTFAPGAVASKYDNWAFYRNQFQNGCFSDNKAVDLVCWHKNESWLIEVKDYRNRNRTKVIDLADEIAAKVRDTLAGLVAASVNANDSEEREAACRFLRTKKFRVVCHLEQPNRPSRLHPRGFIEPDKLLQKLRGKLKAIDPHPLIVSRQNIRYAFPWEVR